MFGVKLNFARNSQAILLCSHASWFIEGIQIIKLSYLRNDASDPLFPGAFLYRWCKAFDQMRDLVSPPRSTLIRILFIPSQYNRYQLIILIILAI